jgi:hypothetical protein
MPLMNHYDPRHYQYVPSYVVGLPHGAHGVVAQATPFGGYSALGGSAPPRMPRKSSLWPAVLGALCLLAGLGLAVPYALDALGWMQATSRYTELNESAERDPREVQAVWQSVAEHRSRAVRWGGLAALSCGGAMCCFVGGFLINRRR